MSTEEEFQVKCEFERNAIYYQQYNDEEQNDFSQSNDTGELTTIKTPRGENISVYFRQGNRILFCYGKFFYIDHTIEETEHQKEHTGVVAICHTCGVRIKGSLKVSSNFICHLKARHPEVYQNFLKQKQESVGLIRVRKSERSNFNNRTSPYTTNLQTLANNLQHPENQVRLQRNILRFLISTNQSINLVEDPNFFKLFEFLDFPLNFKAQQYEQIIKDDCKYKQLELANLFTYNKDYICLTSDIWSFGESKYLALTCHWIDEHYQRQTVLLACIRSLFLEGNSLQTIENNIMLRYGFQKDCIVNTVTANIQNYTKEFIELGINNEALCFDYLGQTEDCTLLKQMQENFQLLYPINDSQINVVQLDVSGLNKIWSIGLTKHLDVKTKNLHRALMEKCSEIWKVSNSRSFRDRFEMILNCSLTRPNIFFFVSLYNSLKELFLNKNQLSEICAFLEIPKFSDLELEYLEELLEVLEPLHAAFEFLDMPQNHFYGCVLPTLVTLKWKLTRLHNKKNLKHLQDLVIKLKEQMLIEFKLYYELNETKSGAILAAITYPPVKTRFLMGLQDSVLNLNVQARNILLKHAKDFYIDYAGQLTGNIMSYNQENMENIKTSSDFFDFGDGIENIDAEELRDVNISKKELSELVAELYDGLMNDGLSMDSIDLESPRRFLDNLYHEHDLNTPNNSPKLLENNLNVSRQLDFEQNQEFFQRNEANTITTNNNINMQQIPDSYTECDAITSTNSQNNYTSLQTNTNSIYSCNNNENNNEQNPLNSNGMTLIPIAQSEKNGEDTHNKTIIVDSSNLNSQLELIAVPIPGQPNSFQLAKVVDYPENKENVTAENSEILKQSSFSTKSLRSSKPYEINYTCNYISVRRHIIAEYIDKFKTLKHAQDNKITSTTTENMDFNQSTTNTGFTQYQYDLMQQQLRIHIQQLTQTFVQTYCHPELWKLAPKSKELLLDLQEKSKENVNFQVWNLESAVELIQNWQKELDENTPENTKLMNFLHHENLVTNHQSRQIPRFHPRILECYLNSPVFLYPKYLPRMPFSAKPTISVFSPAEAYLIAMGLEKHLQIIYEKKEKLSYKTTPLRVACKRLAKDTVCGKGYRRIWDHILHLQKVDYYNPIKYFFEHNRAPPVDHDPIWRFDNNVVLPPKDRIPDLPLVYQTYLQKKNEPPKPKSSKNKKSRKKSPTKLPEVFKKSYLEFVQEAVGQDLPIPNFFNDSAEPSDTLRSNDNSHIAATADPKYFEHQKSTTKKRFPQSLTINVNYVYGNGLDISTTSTNSSLSALPTTSCAIDHSPNNLSQNSETISTVKDLESNINHNTSSTSLPDSTINSTIDISCEKFHNTTTNANGPVITYNFDWRTKTLQPDLDTTRTTLPRLLCSSPTSVLNDTTNTTIAKPQNRKLKAVTKVSRPFKLQGKIKKKALVYREKRLLKRRCEELITTYSLYLDKTVSKYKDYPLIQQYYRHFKALELYTYLLKGLKSICSKNSNIMSNSINSPSNLKRMRNSNSNTEDETNPSSTRQVRKLNRQEENFRHMLLPDTTEEVNRKDAIYAFNFYEKVEEAFKAANKPEDCKKFNNILKSFNPKEDKVSDLYYKLEKLFLPDHPELAQVFLTFLLPSEAAEIGKFFEHFMINNMNTFINKLNIYFNKQPAQIRKIYNCLNDLSEDPDVTMKKVETKIVPLLKGNQFLIDWFMQQFPQNTPPERLFSKPEHINLKDQQCNRSGEYVETITDLTDSPINDNQQQQFCQLRYINGRIFYGSKMLLPAKLSFMAASYKNIIQPNETNESTSPNGCVHGIRKHGEKRLRAAADITSANINGAEPPHSDDHVKLEDDIPKTLVIDTTADEEDSSSSVELCDEASLKAHAIRLNPSFYNSTCYSTANTTSTPNLINNFQTHHANAKKIILNFNEDAKLSPRKTQLSTATTAQINLISPLATSLCNSPVNPKEKRKSPNKKIKSPLSNSNKTLRLNNTAVQPMVVIHETNSAIQCAKRLKSFIEGEEGLQGDIIPEIIDSKEILQIVARTKNSIQSSELLATTSLCENVKEEKSEDLEFLAESSNLSPSPFPCLRMENDSNEEDACISKISKSATESIASVTTIDIKEDIETSLTTKTERLNQTEPSSLSLNTAWTRDEDKIILIEMKMGSQNRKDLYQRIENKLANRTMFEITSRHQFLMDFLSKLQGK